VHALRNMVVPMLTAVGVSLRFSLSTLPIIEVFFLWPGMGLLLLRAINARQAELVVPLALMIGATLVVTNIVLDVIYRFVDPRTREGEWTS
jgi:peptide/nickel transport system permease protein